MRWCELCKESKEVELINSAYVCEGCFEIMCLIDASVYGISDWNQAINFREGYEGAIDKRIDELLIDIISQNSDLKLQIEELLRKIEYEIQIRLQYYHKDELFVAFITVKEVIRRELLVKNKKIDWAVLSDISGINLLMKIANKIKVFENSPMRQLENNCSNFANALCYARRYNTIIENIPNINMKNANIRDICYEAIQTEDTEEYFDKYLKNAVNEKPEDYIIKNEVLRTKMQKEGKSPESILNKLDDIIKKEFCFERKDYQLLSTTLLKMEFPTEEDYWGFIYGKKPLYENFPVVIVEKEKMEQLCGANKLQSILRTFSINQNIDKQNEFSNLELFCFYEVKGLLVFGCFDFIQILSIFEKFLLSGDFVSIYSKNLSINKEITKAQKKLSQYFSACVSDYLYLNGYLLPMETYLNNKIPRFDIEKLYVNGKNILISNKNGTNKLGDIDVLAINPLKKEVLLFELKFFKPAISSKEMFYKDKSKIVDKEVIKHILDREDVVIQNVDEVVKSIIGEYQYGYSVKSILLTARTNFHALGVEKVDYLTWADFIEKVDKKEL